MSVMLLGMIGVVTAPAFAHHLDSVPGQQFKKSTMPEKGEKYVLTISGKTELAGLAGSFTKHAPNKMRAIVATEIPVPAINIAGSGLGTNLPIRPQLAVPITGEVTIKVADFYVSTGKSSSHSSPRSILANPSASVFVVESGTITMGDRTYTVDSGVAIYYKEFTLTVGSGSDFVLNVDGGLSGGMPGGHISNMHSSLKVGGDNWTFKGGISMSKLA